MFVLLGTFFNVEQGHQVSSLKGFRRSVCFNALVLELFWHYIQLLVNYGLTDIPRVVKKMFIYFFNAVKQNCSN